MSRLEWIISGLLGLVIVVAVLGLIFWTMARDQTATVQANGGSTTALDTGHSARQAYELALAVARGWAADARLLNASATWPAGTSFASGLAHWGFQFYSPAARSTALLAVSGGEARVVRRGQAQTDVNALNIDGWLIDSPEVVEIMMNNGGEQFIERTGTSSLTLSLNLVDQFQWQARLIDTQTNEVFSMTINPTNGAASAPTSPAGQ